MWCGVVWYRTPRVNYLSMLFGVSPYAGLNRVKCPLASLCSHCFAVLDHFVGVVVKASASRAADLRLDFRFFLGDCTELSHTSGLNIGIPVVTLSGAWRYRVSAGTGWHVSVYCDWVRWKV